MSLTELESIISSLEELTSKLGTEISEGIHGPTFKFTQMVLDNLNTPCAIIDEGYHLIYANDSFVREFSYYLPTPLVFGDVCYETFHGRKSICEECHVEKSLESRHVLISSRQFPPSDKKYYVICIPLIYDGVAGVIEIIIPEP